MDTDESESVHGGFLGSGVGVCHWGGGAVDVPAGETGRAVSGEICEFVYSQGGFEAGEGGCEDGSGNRWVEGEVDGAVDFEKVCLLLIVHTMLVANGLQHRCKWH